MGVICRETFRLALVPLLPQASGCCKHASQSASEHSSIARECPLVVTCRRSLPIPNTACRNLQWENPACWCAPACVDSVPGAADSTHVDTHPGPSCIAALYVLAPDLLPCQRTSAGPALMDQRLVSLKNLVEILLHSRCPCKACSACSLFSGSAGLAT